MAFPWSANDMIDPARKITSSTIASAVGAKSTRSTRGRFPKRMRTTFNVLVLLEMGAPGSSLRVFGVMRDDDPRGTGRRGRGRDRRRAGDRSATARRAGVQGERFGHA